MNVGSYALAEHGLDKIFEQTNAKITDIILEEKTQPWILATVFQQALSLTEQILITKDSKKDDCYLDPENSWEPKPSALDLYINNNKEFFVRPQMEIITTVVDEVTSESEEKPEKKSAFNWSSALKQLMVNKKQKEAGDDGLSMTETVISDMSAGLKRTLSLKKSKNIFSVQEKDTPRTIDKRKQDAI